MEQNTLTDYLNQKNYNMVVTKLHFTVELNKCNDVSFNFYDNECSPNDVVSGEPYQIFGTIKDEDGNEIGDFNLYELDNDCNFHEKCDDISGDIEVVASAICGKKGNVLRKYVPDATDFDTILILDKITIKKEYRGKGIGSSVVIKLMYMMNYQFDSGKTLFLCASDFETANEYGFDSIEYKEGTKRLVEFYKKLGFKVVKNNVLVCYK